MSTDESLAGSPGDERTLFDDDDAGLGMPGDDRTRDAADGITGDDSGAATLDGSYGTDDAGTPARVIRSRGAPGAPLLVGLRSNRLSSSTRRGGLPLVPASRLAASSSWPRSSWARPSAGGSTWIPQWPCGSVPAGPIASTAPWSTIVGRVWSSLAANARISTRCSD